MQESLTIPRNKSQIFGQENLDMRSDLDHTTSFLKRTRAYRIQLTKDEDDGRIVVTSPDLAGLVTDGKDEKEAVINAFEAIEALLESAGENIKDEAITLIQKSVA